MSATGTLPRFTCPACGRAVAATTSAPYALTGGATYHYLRRHQGSDGATCPARSVLHALDDHQRRHTTTGAPPAI